MGSALGDPKKKYGIKWLKSLEATVFEGQRI